MSTLEGKIAFVTGASSGLGAETARLLSRRGATIFGIGRDAARLAEVFGDVEKGSPASVNIASAQACKNALQQCARGSGAPGGWPSSTPQIACASMRFAPAAC